MCHTVVPIQVIKIDNEVKWQMTFSPDDQGYKVLRQKENRSRFQRQRAADKVRSFIYCPIPQMLAAFRTRPGQSQRTWNSVWVFHMRVKDPTTWTITVCFLGCALVGNQSWSRSGIQMQQLLYRVWTFQGHHLNSQSKVCCFFPDLSWERQNLWIPPELQPKLASPSLGTNQ